MFMWTNQGASIFFARLWFSLWRWNRFLLRHVRINRKESNIGKKKSSRICQKQQRSRRMGDVLVGGVREAFDGRNGVRYTEDRIIEKRKKENDWMEKLPTAKLISQTRNTVHRRSTCPILIRFNDAVEQTNNYNVWVFSLKNYMVYLFRENFTIRYINNLVFLRRCTCDCAIFQVMTDKRVTALERLDKLVFKSHKW